jgi:hypothetical protein
MAENKKSFVLYADLIHTVKKMPDDKAGILLKTILSYVNDENPIIDDIMIDLVFEPIKRQMKRDLEKWDMRIEKRSEAGKKGMEARWGKKETITNDNNVINAITNITDTVTVNDTVNVNVNVTKDNIERRKINFATSLKIFVDEFGRDTVKDFYNYWIEPNKSKTKMRWEMEKTWDLNLRLKKWASNNFNKNNNGQSTNNAPKLGTSEARIAALRNW